jgi:hypothetical protein
MLAPGIAVIVPPHGFHRLFWNNYPATAFDHDLSDAVEAALLFISIDSFLRDPKGLTCITLHFFTDFSEVFTSDTVIGRLSCRPRSRNRSMKASRLKLCSGKFRFCRFSGYGR